MSVTGDPTTGPTKVGVAVVDVVTGLHATVGILAALRHRDRTGDGQRVEVNLLSSLLSALEQPGRRPLSTGHVPQPMGNRHPSIAPYEVLATADRPLAVAAANDKLFAQLVGGVSAGRSWRTTRGTRRTRPGSRTATSWSPTSRRCCAPLRGRLVRPRLSALGVPCGPINDLAQAFALAERLGL